MDTTHWIIIGLTSETSARWWANVGPFYLRFWDSSSHIKGKYMLSLGRPCWWHLSVLVTVGAHVIRQPTKWEIRCRNLVHAYYVGTRFLDLLRSRCVSSDNARVRGSSVKIESGERWEYPLWPPPANARHWPKAALMLGHCLRRWPNIKPALGHFIVLTGHIRPDCVAFPASL